MSSENWSRENLAWLAGILEGEGTFILATPKERRPRGVIVLRMCDRDVVERAAEIGGVGMAVSPVGMRKYYPAHWKEQFAWRVQAQHEVVALIWAIWPWMAERRREQMLAILRSWTESEARYGKRVPRNPATDRRMKAARTRPAFPPVTM